MMFNVVLDYETGFAEVEEENMEERIELLLNIIRFCEERCGDYGIENTGYADHMLWVVLGNRTMEMNTKDTEKLRDLWDQMQHWG